MVLWVLGDDIAAYFPRATERVLDLIYSVPGGAFGDTTLRLFSGVASSVVRALNPFDGARDALRLHPVKVSLVYPFAPFVAASCGRCVDQRELLLELRGTTFCLSRALQKSFVALFLAVVEHTVFLSPGDTCVPQRLGSTPFLSAAVQVDQLFKKTFPPVSPGVGVVLAARHS